ncbi:hypothetical protein DX883_04500 [Vibrio fluvialis]|nr:hypothetical protein [Vibrio fluvialis]
MQGSVLAFDLASLAENLFIEEVPIDHTFRLITLTRKWEKCVSVFTKLAFKMIILDIVKTLA